jgi:hypothetical protein
MNIKPRQNELGEGAPIGLARTAVLWAVLFGAACSDSTGPVSPVRIVPQASSVMLQATPQGQALNATFILTNTSSFQVAWGTCGVTLEKAGLPALPPGKTEWQMVWARVCYLLDALASQSRAASSAIPWDYMVLKPGESATISISAIVGQPPNTNFTGEPGLYRIRVPLSMNVLGFDRAVPADQSVSEPFTLVGSH